MNPGPRGHRGGPTASSRDRHAHGLFRVSAAPSSLSFLTGFGFVLRPASYISPPLSEPSTHAHQQYEGARRPPLQAAAADDPRWVWCLAAPSVDMCVAVDGSLWQHCRELRTALARCGCFSCSTFCARTRRHGQRELPMQWPSAVRRRRAVGQLAAGGGRYLHGAVATALAVAPSPADVL